MTLVFDVVQGRRVDQRPVGTTGQISMQRLAQLLKDSGEIGRNETVTHLEVGRDGFVIYRVEHV